MLIHLILNGERRTLSLPDNVVSDLFKALDLDPTFYIVELNGEVFKAVPGDQKLNDGDVVEILQFMGGG